MEVEIAVAGDDSLFGATENTEEAHMPILCLIQ